MAAESRLTIRMPGALATRLERVARESERSRSFVALRAIEAYCEDEEEILAKIREGLADAEAGRVVPHSRVRPWLEDLARGKVRRRPRPR